MKHKILFNILEGFDHDLVNDPNFKEDSVREEIILPILKGLGYSANKPYQIVRSKGLIHPFVSIGSQKKKIYMIPDYLLEVDGRPAWILDAKSPAEDILKSAHAEQAYSYAIHPEVRAGFFALCNGREFALYSINKLEPTIHIPLQSLPNVWESLKATLSPPMVLDEKSHKFKKDLGLHLKRIGFEQFEALHFQQMPIRELVKLKDDLFTVSSGLRFDGDDYLATFDFDLDMFQQLKGKIPQEVIDTLSPPITDRRVGVKFSNVEFYVNVACKVGKKMEENEDEIYLPLWVTGFS